LRVLMVTPEWPTADRPYLGAFIVQQVEHLRKLGVHVEVFDFRGAKRPWNYLAARRRLRKQYDLSSFNVVHAQFGHAALVAFPVPTNLVITFHGSDLQGIPKSNNSYSMLGWVARRISRFFSRRADAVVIVSNRLRPFLPKKLSVHVIPGGVDLDVFKPMDRAAARKELGLPLDKPLVLFGASRHRPVKRFDIAAEAVARLPDSWETQLVVLEGVRREQVPLYMNACDVLVLTSKHEGSPTVVKEAHACNLPVVSVDVGDVRERIAGVKNCILCEQDTPEVIGKALETVLQARERSNGREMVRDLDESKVAERVLRLYETVAAPQQLGNTTNRSALRTDGNVTATAVHHGSVN
jgi:teichuronic acid biosynthesis glycosyltransferase TuaC